MFIVSKRNIAVNLPNGGTYKIAKNFMGEIPDEVGNLPFIKGAIASGWIATADNHSDKAIHKGVDAAAEKEKETDVRRRK